LKDGIRIPVIYMQKEKNRFTMHRIAKRLFFVVSKNS